LYARGRERGVLLRLVTGLVMAGYESPGSA
jgi:hypothetical protein